MPTTLVGWIKTTTRSQDITNYYEGSLSEPYDASKLVSTKSVINMQGVNALHQGVELDFVAKTFPMAGFERYVLYR